MTTLIVTLISSGFTAITANATISVASATWANCAAANLTEPATAACVAANRAGRGPTAPAKNRTPAATLRTSLMVRFVRGTVPACAELASARTPRRVGIPANFARSVR